MNRDDGPSGQTSPIEGIFTGGGSRDKLDGVAVLRAVVAATEAIDEGAGRAKRIRPYLDLLGDSTRMQAVIVASVSRGDEIEGLVTQLGLSLTATTAAQLRKRIAAGQSEHKERIKRSLRVVDDEADAESVMVRTAVDWSLYPDGVAVPSGWRLTPESLARLRMVDGRVEEHHVGAPLLVTRRIVDADDGTYSLELAWHDRDEWRTERVPRSVALDSRGLVRLADQGLPVSGSTSRDLVDWLTRLDQQQALPTDQGSARMGWVGRGRKHYLLGRRCIARDGDRDRVCFVPATAGARQLADAIEPAGTWDGWLSAVEIVRDQPAAWLAIYAAASAPLLRPLDAPNFGVDFAGGSTGGKTTLLQLAVSLYGMPRNGRGYRSWGATLAGAEGTAGVLCDLPLALNEGQLVPATRRAEAGALLYALAEGSSRAKGALGRLGLAQVDDWRTVVISTSEEGITSWAPTDGVRARILEVHGSPLASAEQAESLAAAIREHHGHLMPWLIRTLVGIDHECVTVMREDYREKVAEYAAMTTSKITRRAAQYMATIAMAAHYVHGVLPVPAAPEGTLKWIWAQVCASCGEADQAARALETTWTWVAANRDLFQSGPGRTPNGGWLGWWLPASDVLVIQTATLKRMLAGAGYGDSTAIFRRWAEMKWSRTSTGRVDYRLPSVPPGMDIRPAGIAILLITRDGVNAAGPLPAAPKPKGPDTEPPVGLDAPGETS